MEDFCFLVLLLKIITSLFHLMKSKNVLKLLLVTLLLSVWSFNSTAQSKRIGVVFMANTNLVYRKIGLFSHPTTAYPPYIAFSKYINESLETQLTPYDYSISICEIPDSVKYAKTGFTESFPNKKFKTWASSKIEEYDILILVENMPMSLADASTTPFNTSGILTKLGKEYLYSTLSFYSYDIEKSKLKNYIHNGGNFLYHLKGFKLPKKDEEKYTPENIDFIRSEFKKYIDNRIEYFITESQLIPENKEKRYKNDLY